MKNPKVGDAVRLFLHHNGPTEVEYRGEVVKVHKGRRLDVRVTPKDVSIVVTNVRHRDEAAQYVNSWAAIPESDTPAIVTTPDAFETGP